MATNTATQQAPASTVALVDEASAIEVGSIAALKKAFTKARKDWTEADDALKSAAQARSMAAVWMARIAYRTATHEAVATARYKVNITGAARELGMPVATLRPYALAGQALHNKDRAGLLSEPDVDDMTIVEASFDATSRADQKEKRIKEKAKKEALEAKARELDALKAQAPVDGDTKAPEGPQAPVPSAPSAGTDKAPEAPAKAPEAPAGPSLAEDTMATAKELVRKLKALKASGNKEAILKVNAILGDFYPALKA